MARDYVLREQAVMMNATFERGPLNGVTTSTWPDVPSNHWALRHIESASQNHYYSIDSDGNEWIVKE